MATVHNTRASLFERLARVRASLTEARKEVDRLRDLMRTRKAQDWNSDEDLRVQLGEAVEALDEAIYQVTPLSDHADQPLKREAELSRG